MKFADRAVIVTGAAGTLGSAVARAFHDAGANLVLVGRRRSALEAEFGDEGERRMYYAANLLQREETDALVAATRKRFGAPYVLCNIAGGFAMGDPVHETADETWEQMFDVNVRTLLNAVRSVVPSMLDARAGKIVNVGSVAAQKGAARMGAYCAAKSVVIRITESMAAELRSANINVNCVLPTIIDTPENRASMPGSDPAKWIAPADLAQTVLFLASSAARAIHGASLTVTGQS